jgi:hypothetical protein
MASLQEEILENVRAGTGPCAGCPARGECLHVGFFDYEADVLVVGHEPSLSHFDYSAYDIEKSIDWYHEFYEASGRIESWGFYDFLTELFSPLGIDSSDLPEYIYMTDLVKCPTKEFDDRDWDTAFEHCESYFERELTGNRPQSHSGSR